MTASNAPETAQQNCLDGQVLETKGLDGELRRLLRSLIHAFNPRIELLNVNDELCGVLGELHEKSN